MDRCLTPSPSRFARLVFAGVLAGGALLVLPGRPAAAQCSLVSPPLPFEPNPPGVSRVGSNLSSGKQTDLQVFRAGGSPRMVMLESFGYSILDLSDPASPSAIVYDNMQGGEMAAAGDGQSYVASIGVSPDGARLALGLNGNASPLYGSVAATAGGNGTFNHITGGFTPRGAAGTIVQGVASRYLAYSVLPSSSLATGAFSVADITNLPGPLAPANIASEQIGPGGVFLTLAGNSILYLNQGTIRVYDASSPGPVGNIGGSFGLTTLSSTTFAGRVPTAFSAAIDPKDASRLWVLVELSSPLSYALVSLKAGVTTVAPWTFDLPEPVGEAWVAGGVSALIPNGNGLFALMWARKFGSPVIYRLFSTSVQDWGTKPGQFDVDSNSYPTFALNYFMRGLAGTGNALYAYLATGNSAYALSLSCVAGNDGGVGPEVPDAGAADAGGPDSGTPDAGGPNGGLDAGCGCQTSGLGPGGPGVLFVLAMIVARQRRRGTGKVIMAKSKQCPPKTVDASTDAESTSPKSHAAPARRPRSGP